MMRPKEHPITTPKGASAISILLGAVGVFTPFMLNFNAALLFGGVAILVISWVYWADLRSTVFVRSWNRSLNIPAAAILTILVMGVISARNVANSPKPVQPASADEMASRVAALLAKQISSAPRKSDPPASTPREELSPTKSVGSTLYSSNPPRSRAQIAGDARTDTWIKDLEIRMIRDKAQQDAYWSCVHAKIAVTGSLYKLISQAAGFQNGWAYSRDGEQLRHQYEGWIGAVHHFLDEHKDVLGNTDEFDQIKDLDMGPTLLVIPSSGTNAWHNFDSRRTALDHIGQAYSQSDKCSALQAATSSQSSQPGK